MNKKIKIFSIIIFIIFLLIVFLNITYKTVRTGNNISKSNNDLIDNILNISSYEAMIEVTINSNKTTNKYELEQHYVAPNYSKQIVKSPQNIENLEIIYDGKNLEIKNTNLGLSKIYENYSYLNDNVLWLNCFSDNCNNNRYTIEEIDDEIIINTNFKQHNLNGKLYINKKTNLPRKIELLDNSNQSKIYIEYKEIKLNNIQVNNIFAFTTKDIKVEV